MFSMLMAFYEGYPLVYLGFSSQRVSNMGSNEFFDISLNKLVNKQSSCQWFVMPLYTISGLILGLRPANERRRYKVTSLIGWAQT